MKSKFWYGAVGVAGALAISSCSGTGPGGAAAGSWPSGNIRFVIPYTAGGPTDLGARIMSDCVKSKVGGQWINENVPGGAGAPAMSQVAAAKPDGKTFGLGTQSVLVITPSVVAKDAPYDYQSFDYLGQIMSYPSVIVVPADSPYRTMPELLAAAKAQPEKLAIATSGAQTSFSFAVRQLNQEGAGLKLVPFDGDAEANVALLGKNVVAKWGGANPETLKLVEEGKFRAIAVGSKDGYDELAEVQTFAEAGLAHLLSTDTFFPIVAPAGLDDEIKKKVAEAVATCVDSAEFKEALGQQVAYLDGTEVRTRLADFHSKLLEIK